MLALAASHRIISQNIEDKPFVYVSEAVYQTEECTDFLNFVTFYFL